MEVYSPTLLMFSNETPIIREASGERPMIRLLLHSEDVDLAALLAPTLGSGFSTFFERRRDRVRELISQGQCDVLILDLNSSSFPIQQQFEFFDEIRHFGGPGVGMKDDDSKATAM